MTIEKQVIRLVPAWYDKHGDFVLGCDQYMKEELEAARSSRGISTLFLDCRDAAFTRSVAGMCRELAEFWGGDNVTLMVDSAHSIEEQEKNLLEWPYTFIDIRTPLDGFTTEYYLDYAVSLSVTLTKRCHVVTNDLNVGDRNGDTLLIDTIKYFRNSGAVGLRATGMVSKKSEAAIRSKFATCVGTAFTEEQAVACEKLTHNVHAGDMDCGKCGLCWGDE